MITIEEYLELKELYNDGYRWIARDSCEIIYAYKLEPIKLGFSWKYSKNNIATTCGDDFLLPYVYVKWEDEKPTKILDLIQDYEAHKEIVGENVKVTIPQFVADWIEECKPIYNLRRLFSTTHMPDSVKNWTSGDDDNCNLMALAWIYGYEVEEEQKYFVSSRESVGFWFLSKNNDNEVVIGTNKDYYDRKWESLKLTEEEIRDYDERYWTFAVKVEEVE